MLSIFGPIPPGDYLIGWGVAVACGAAVGWYARRCATRPAKLWAINCRLHEQVRQQERDLDTLSRDLRQEMDYAGDLLNNPRYYQEQRENLISRLARQDRFDKTI